MWPNRPAIGITIIGGAIVIGSGLYTLHRENLRQPDKRAPVPG